MSPEEIAAKAAADAATKAEEELDLDLTLEEPTEEETVETLKEKLGKTNKKLGLFGNVVARAKAAEAEVKRLKPLVIEKKPEANKDLDGLKSTVNSLELAEKKRQFGYENKLSPEETDAVFLFTPTPTKETLKNPFVEGGLAKLRSLKRVDENTPGSSSRTGKPLKIKPDATPAEKQEAFDNKIAGLTQKR